MRLASKKGFLREKGEQGILHKTIKRWKQPVQASLGKRGKCPMSFLLPLVMELCLEVLVAWHCQLSAAMGEVFSKLQHKQENRLIALEQLKAIHLLNI